MGKSTGVKFDGIKPTRERIGEFDESWQIADGSRHRAYRRVPIIDTLRKQWLDDHKLPKEQRRGISPEEHAALVYYRDQATKAEDDCAQEGTLSPSRVMGGVSGTCAAGYIPASLLATPAILETARIERDLGELRDIANAIAVRDLSLTQWCVEKHGGRERYDGKGRFIAIVPVNEKLHVGVARMELRMAAHRIVR